MNFTRILLRAFAAFLILLFLGISVSWILTSPEGLPDGSVSAARLEPGPYRVAEAELEWVDDRRPTQGRTEAGRSLNRTFRVALWYPEDADGVHPLVVYSHGFMSSRRGGTFLAEDLASRGTVVVAADFPLTHAVAPGGPDVFDVVNQPADVSFLIDRSFALAMEGAPFEGSLDAARIGVVGLSLGGLTSTLVAFDPNRGDPRIAAAISIAGPTDIFGRDFFDHADVPFLLIAGTADAVIDFEHNAAPLPDLIRDGGLLAIEGGTHVGFDQAASGIMRILGNPDGLACALARMSADREEFEHPENPFVGLFGTTDEGFLEPGEFEPGCTRSFPNVMDAETQQQITTLAVRAFFDSRFAETAEARADAVEFLTDTLPAEIASVRYEPSRR